MTTQQEVLQEYSDEKRLAIYKLLTSACTHLYSKGKLQDAKFEELAPIFADLTKNDPLFMAHLTSFVAKGDSKDLKVLTTFFNALNDADGTPFFEGATRNKPNFREVSSAILQRLDPHLVLRVLQFCHRRFSVKKLLNEATHFPTSLRTAFRKYIRYREENPDMLRGMKNKGLARKMQSVYRLSRIGPSDEAASILNWRQGSHKKGTKREIDMESLPEFENMTSKQVAEALLETKISPIVAMSVIPRNKITSVVAKALLENCTGNQTVILYNWFNRNGFLDVKVISGLFKDKVKESTTAVDRIDTLTKEAAEEDKKEMAEVRSKRRKKQASLSDIGRIFLHIDKSTSMSGAIEFAKDRACVLAECVENPEENFAWGLFGTKGQRLDLPSGFTKEHFHEALYGVIASDNSTDCLALYKQAREFGAEVDVYVTDEGHNVGQLVRRLSAFHSSNTDLPKPKAAVIIKMGRYDTLSKGLESVGIPFTIIKPETLTESALVAQSIRTAMIGELAIIDSIMETPLPKLPKWWNTVGSKNREMESVNV